MGKKRILSSFNFKCVKIFLVNIQDYLNPHTNYLIKSKTYDNIINQSWWAFEVIMIQLSILNSIMTKKKVFLLLVKSFMFYDGTFSWSSSFSIFQLAFHFLICMPSIKVFLLLVPNHSVLSFALVINHYNFSLINKIFTPNH